MQSSVIQDKNLITPYMIEQILEYKTFKFYADKRKTSYVGNITADISGFIKNEIERIWLNHKEHKKRLEFL